MIKKRVIIVAMVSSIALAGCVTNQEGGALVGGASGALLGSTIGKGSGKLLATGVGAIGGAIVGSKVGESMDRPRPVEYVPVPPHRPLELGDRCSRYYGNDGAVSACKRGISERKALEQRKLEEEAYRSGRGQ